MDPARAAWWSTHEWLLGLAGLRAEFSATGVYVIVASVAGLLVGALCGLFLDRAELVTLVAVLVGAALAGWVMVQVGQALGPPDPRELAETARDGTRLPSDLRIVGNEPLRRVSGRGDPRPRRRTPGDDEAARQVFGPPGAS